MPYIHIYDRRFYLQFRSIIANEKDLRLTYRIVGIWTWLHAVEYWSQTIPNCRLKIIELSSGQG